MGGLENYFNAKAKIFLPPQEPEYVILNAKDVKLKEFASKCKNVIFFDNDIDSVVIARNVSDEAIQKQDIDCHENQRFSRNDVKPVV